MTPTPTPDLTRDAPRLAGALADALATLTGRAWTAAAAPAPDAQPPRPARCYPWYCTIHSPDGEILYVSTQGGTGSKPGQVRIGGVYPLDCYQLETRFPIWFDGQRVNDPDPIYVGAARPPAAQAVEVARRFLPGYRVALAAAQRDNAESADRAARKARHAARLAAVIGAEVRPGDAYRPATLDVYHSRALYELAGVAVEISHDGARVELGCLTVDEAEAVLRALAATRPVPAPPPDDDA